MGIVYEAYDRVRCMRVALKQLRAVDAANVYRLKREFRALADLSHPNIVTLYELVFERDEWFLTMELVDGQDFVSYVRGLEPQAAADRDETEPDESHTTAETRTSRLSGWMEDPMVSTETSHLGLPVPPSQRPTLTEVVDVQRLRRALRQLAQAVYALHAAGKVHRDLKPSNVRVTEQGRVVVMDFGIVADKAQAAGSRASPHSELDDHAIGTPAFMAPEQVRGASPSAAADWYAFGVMLYVSLTQRLPYEGMRAQIMHAKQQRDPLRPSLFVAGVPDKLERLCMGLLSRLPAVRPDGDAVLQALGLARTPTDRSDEVTTFGSGPASFVGRDAELAFLRDCYDEVSDGRTLIVFVQGPSRIGKTSMVSQFVRRLSRSITPGLVLSSRCLQYESLPYKAFDGIVDHLVHYLSTIPESERAAIAQDNISILARLFPVLHQIVDGDRLTDFDSIDRNPSTLRSRAVAVLREQIAALAERQPLILRIEDFQWADRDSVDLLARLLEDPPPPRLLIIATLPAEELDMADEAFLTEVMLNLQQRDLCHQITLGPLSQGEQDRLLGALLRDPDPAVCAALRAEAAGHPLLLTELAWHVSDSIDELSPKNIPHLTDVVWSRVTSVPANARALIEVVAVCVQPTPIEVVARAAELSDADRERAAVICRLNHLARPTRHGNEHRIILYHKRVGEVIRDRLPPQRLRDIHRAVALALEERDTPAALLAHHWQSAGDPHRATRYLIQAAQRASQQLAIERTHELLDRAELLARQHQLADELAAIAGLRANNLAVVS